MAKGDLEKKFRGVCMRQHKAERDAAGGDRRAQSIGNTRQKDSLNSSGDCL